ncbi:hypothetical protein Tco_1136939 [Tanacetum coccineum]
MKALLRVMRYIKLCLGQGLHFANSTSLSVYCDSDWAACLINRRSVTGYTIFLESCLISWTSKKQLVVSRVQAFHTAMVLDVLQWVKELFLCSRACKKRWLLGKTLGWTDGKEWRINHVTLQTAADLYGVKFFILTSFKDIVSIELLPKVQKSKRCKV